eukprot:9488363-Pyramimonas_sp.AAC.1
MLRLAVMRERAGPRNRTFKGAARYCAIGAAAKRTLERLVLVNAVAVVDTPTNVKGPDRSLAVQITMTRTPKVPDCQPMKIVWLSLVNGAVVLAGTIDACADRWKWDDNPESYRWLHSDAK